MSTDRDRLADIIRPILPAGWRIQKHTVRVVETLAAPSVFLDFTSITHDAMPVGAVVDGFEVTLVSHLTDYAKAEDALDDAVRTLIRGLDAHELIAWARADKRAVGDQGYLAWVVTVQLISTTSEQE